MWVMPRANRTYGRAYWPNRIDPGSEYITLEHSRPETLYASK